MLDATVRSLLLDVLDPAGTGRLDPRCLDAATRDMLGRIDAMPRYLGLGMKALTVLFEASGPRHSTLPGHRRVKRVEGWRRSRVGPCRDFVEFYEKMGTFVYYSHVEHGA